VNIQQAIKSGRPFRRPCSSPWLVWEEDMVYPATEKGSADAVVHLTGADLAADDWEVREPTVTITASQFWDAVAKSERLYWPNPAAGVLAGHLGLESATTPTAYMPQTSPAERDWENKCHKCGRTGTSYRFCCSTAIGGS
jgi:hypothetical protein